MPLIDVQTIILISILLIIIIPLYLSLQERQTKNKGKKMVSALNVEIEAFQMTKEARQDNSNWTNWMHEAWQKEQTEQGALYPSEFPNSDGTDKLILNTLNDKVLIEWNDFIVKDINGKLYTCNPDYR